MRRLTWMIGFFFALIGFVSLKGVEGEVALSSPSYRSSKSIGKTFSKPFIDASKAAIPAVVSIEAEGGLSYSQPDPRDLFSDEFFRRFFGGPPQRQRRPKMSQGSGFIISADGYIMTNYHVVFNAEKITVYLQNGTNLKLNATLIGGDRTTDIAVIKIDDAAGQTFPYLEIGNSEELDPGEWVIAVGNPFQLESTVTAGIISFKGRQNLQISEYEDFIQHTAPINPGNSGGPLVSLDKKVVGMNTAIVTPTGAHAGIGLAIPSIILLNIKNQLIKSGKVDHGFLGISIQKISPDLAEAFRLSKAAGVVILQVIPGSVAEKAGLKEGDILLKLNGKPIKDDASFKKSILIIPPETEITLTVNRQGKVFNLPIVIGSKSRSQFASSSVKLPLLGIAIDNTTAENIDKYHLDKEEQGVVIIHIDRNSPAFGKLHEGNLIKTINREEVKNVADALAAMKNVAPGQKVPIFVRQGQAFHIYSFTAGYSRELKKD
ncbi:MAG: trypsin-like peptidase domain-containing protein [Chlamydiota bacterium]